MRRFVLLLGTMLLAVLLMSGVALSQETVQGTIDANCQLVNVGLGAWQPLAQTFTAGNDGRITDITLGASVPGTSEGTGDVVVQITTLDATGDPSSNVLAEKRIPYSGMDLLLTEIHFDYRSAAEVVAGQRYALVLQTQGFSGYINMAGYSRNPMVVDPCPGGALYGQFPDNQFHWFWDYYDREGYVDAKYAVYITPPDTLIPSGSVLINGGAERTTTRTVTLTLDAADPSSGSGVESMRIKNAGGSWSAWQPYTESKDWKLTRGSGNKTVYVQYKDAAGNVSAKASDSITYRP